MNRVTTNHSLLFLVVALVCFVVALLLALSVFDGGNYPAWIAGGLIAFVAAHLP